MANTGELQTDPLFVGLTRPPLFLGVSYMWCILNGGGVMVAFINTSNPLILLIMPLMHAVGYLLCSKEPLFIELFMVRSQKCNGCKNKMFHGANSYDCF